MSSIKSKYDARILKIIYIKGCINIFGIHLQNKPLLGAIIMEFYYRIQDELDKLKGIITEKDVNDYQETDIQIEGRDYSQ